MYVKKGTYKVLFSLVYKVGLYIEKLQSATVSVAQWNNIENSNCSLSNKWNCLITFKIFLRGKIKLFGSYKRKENPLNTDILINTILETDYINSKIIYRLVAIFYHACIQVDQIILSSLFSFVLLLILFIWLTCYWKMCSNECSLNGSNRRTTLLLHN